MGRYTTIENLKEGKKNRCVWCKHNEYRCRSNSVEATCDFRTLPLQKEAILHRMKKEKELLDKMKRNIDKADVAVLRDLFDKAAGLAIMKSVLISELHMTDEEVRKAVGLKDDRWAEKMKLLLKVKHMQKQRGGI